MATPDLMEIQKNFLDKLKHSLSSNVSFVDSLSDLLDISIDSVYRRMRGETALTFDEILILCNHYKVTFDSLVETNHAGVTFNYSVLPRSVEGFKMYLRSILNDLKSLKTAENINLFYVAFDIPLFYLFAYPELAAFKMYYWMRSVLNVHEYQEQKYSFDITDKEILEIGHELLEAYSQVGSIEIWTDNTTGSLKKQIEYYWEAGFFSNDDEALVLCDQAISLIKSVNHKAELGTKQAGNERSEYKLYFSDIEIGNNCILLEVDGMRRVYHTYNTFNKMVTSNNRFCEESLVWINSIIGKSTLISGVSEKQRIQFINKLLKQFEHTKSIITNV